MDIKVYNQSGTSKAKMSISDKVFAVIPKEDLVFQVATSQMSNMRKVLAHARTRSEVSGGGKKPWKQKGTGRARHGSIRSPIWKGGGVTHGPSKDANFKRKVTTTAARKALACVLSARVAEGHLLVVDGLDLETGKTKVAAQLFAKLGKSFETYKTASRILLALPGTKDDAMIRRAVNNLPHVDSYRASDLNALIVLSYPYMVVTKDAMAVIEGTIQSR